MNLESCYGQSMNPGASLQAGSFRTYGQTKLGNIFTKLKCNVFLRRAQTEIQFRNEIKRREGSRSLQSNEEVSEAIHCS